MSAFVEIKVMASGGALERDVKVRSQFDNRFIVYNKNLRKNLESEGIQRGQRRRSRGRYNCVSRLKSVDS